MSSPPVIERAFFGQAQSVSSRHQPQQTRQPPVRHHLSGHGTHKDPARDTAVGNEQTAVRSSPEKPAAKAIPRENQPGAQNKKAAGQGVHATIAHSAMRGYITEIRVGADAALQNARQYYIEHQRQRQKHSNDPHAVVYAPGTIDVCNCAVSTVTMLASKPVHEWPIAVRESAEGTAQAAIQRLREYTHLLQILLLFMDDGTYSMQQRFASDIFEALAKLAVFSAGSSRIADSSETDCDVFSGAEPTGGKQRKKRAGEGRKEGNGFNAELSSAIDDLNIAAMYTFCFLARQHPQDSFNHVGLVLPDGSTASTSFSATTTGAGGRGRGRGGRPTHAHQQQLTVLNVLLYHGSLKARRAACCVIATIVQVNGTAWSQAVENTSKTGAQSFSALSSRLAGILLSLYRTLLDVITKPQPAGANNKARRTPAQSGNDAASPATRAVWINTLALVARYTPFHRCPSIMHALFSTLQSGYLTECISGGDRNMMAAALHLLAELFRLKVLQRSLDNFLAKNIGKQTLDVVQEALPHADALRCFTALANIHPDEVRLRFPQFISSCMEIFGGEMPGDKTAEARERQVQTVTQRLEVMQFCVAYIGPNWEVVTITENRMGKQSTQNSDRIARANDDEKTVMLRQLVLTGVKDSSSGEVRSSAMKCLAQLPASFLSTRPEEQLSELVDIAKDGLVDPDPHVRSAALSTVGHWGMSSSLFAKTIPHWAIIVAGVMINEGETDVREKASWSLAAMCEQLKYTRNAPYGMIQNLMEKCLASLLDDQIVVCNSVRAVGYLLQCVADEDLTNMLAKPRVPLVNAAIQAMSGTMLCENVKTCWNACHAVGESLGRESVIRAYPEGSHMAIATLVTILADSNNFKVRSRAADAIAKVPKLQYFGQHFVRALGVSLTVLHGLASGESVAGADATFSQYQEMGKLRERLGALVVRLMQLAFELLDDARTDGGSVDEVAGVRQAMLKHKAVLMDTLAGKGQLYSNLLQEYKST